MRKLLLSLFLAGLLLATAAVNYASWWWPLTLRDGQRIEVELKEHLFATAAARLQLEVANAPASITAGLSGRPTLVDRQGQVIDGLLFIFPDRAQRHFWMKEMRFAIDICWLNQQDLLSCELAPPPAADAELASLTIYSSPKAVDMVLETLPDTLQQLAGLRLFPVW